MINLLGYNNNIISLNEDKKKHIDEYGSGEIENLSKFEKKRKRDKKVRENDEMKKGWKAGLRVFEDLTLGFLNVRSLHNKVEEVVDLMSKYRLAGLFLAETWHNSGSVCLSILRQKRVLFLEKTKSRSLESFKFLKTNHSELVF